MKALIMAAGMGTRLLPLTSAVPKPMIPIAGKPIMAYNLELLKKYKLMDITANIHYFPEQVQNYFTDGSEFGVDLAYSYEEILLGTAGGVKRMGREINDIHETFLVLSSDALTDINLTKLISYHKKKKALATIALQPVEDPSQYGVVVTDKEGRITAFQEKPKEGKALSNLVNTGIYIFEPEILDMIPQGEYDFGKQLFPRLIRKKAPLFGCPMVEYWCDVGSMEQYFKANYDVLHGRVRVLIPGKKVSKNIWIGKDSKIDPSARFEGAVVIGEGCKIGANTVISKCSIVGRSSLVRKDSTITESIIWSDVIISERCRISKSVIGNWCYLEDEVVMGEDCVIGNRCRLKRGTNLIGGTRLKPDEIVEATP